ncbi:MAG: hypothetical protein NXI23_07995 [Bacteroidetes bacterium]|jgi:hypothetical protein|nr:hypothetical protein [Bacteroidota bacterium]MDF1864852.1 hypothetical protein [Saprospiraceae bacterium]
MFSLNAAPFFAPQTFSVDVVIGTGSGMQWGAFDCSEVYSKVFFTK